MESLPHKAVKWGDEEEWEKEKRWSQQWTEGPVELGKWRQGIQESILIECNGKEVYARNWD